MIADGNNQINAGGRIRSDEPVSAYKVYPGSWIRVPGEGCRPFNSAAATERGFFKHTNQGK
jgi:hypothetical protein